MKPAFCECKGFELNSETLTQVFLWSDIHGFRYDGDKFDFCPWCGNPMIFLPMTDEEIQERLI